MYNTLIYLSAFNGTLGPRVAHDMVWNRTANLRGGEENNLALDYVNELLNKEFKGETILICHCES
jgi:hypothetical protein